MLRYKTKTRPGLVALYDIRPGNGAGPFLQPRSPRGTERRRNAEIKERLEPVNMVLMRDRLSRFRHVERKDEVDWLKACMTIEVDETRQMGRTKKT